MSPYMKEELQKNTLTGECSGEGIIIRMEIPNTIKLTVDIYIESAKTNNK